VAGGDHGVRGALAGRGLEVVAAGLLGEPPLGGLVARRGVPRVLPQSDGDDDESPGHSHNPQHGTGHEHPGTTPLARRRPGCCAPSARRKPTTG
jgi:hypothetical protein